VAKFIRWSRRFKPRPSVRKFRSVSTTEWIAKLQSPDVFTRVVAAETLAAQPELAPTQKQEAIAALRKQLEDDASIEFGVKGRSEVDGRIYFWCMERKTPRASAVTALFALGYRPNDDGLVRAMLAESGRAARVCGEKVVPTRFPTEFWRSAVQGAGGMDRCEYLFGQLLKALGERPFSREVNEQYECSDEVKRVVASLTLRQTYNP
jgi:hypothetical protein